jgi:hypothetical protein
LNVDTKDAHMQQLKHKPTIAYEIKTSQGKREAMKEIEDIKKLLASISQKFDSMAQNEQKFDLDTCIYFEHLSHDTYRMCNNLEYIKQSYGV